MAYPEISLDKNVVVVAEQTANTVKVLQIEENPDEKRVVATTSLNGLLRRFVLWEGDSYDQIGQWTDTDVITRVKEVVGV
jgi:hypothetical protein